MPTRVAVLGAGNGGCAAAADLRRVLRKQGLDTCGRRATYAGVTLADDGRLM